METFTNMCKLLLIMQGTVLVHVTHYVFLSRCQLLQLTFTTYFYVALFLVEGGHRAIMFNRIGGIQQEIYPEGLHFRIPWFQYPIIYDIR